MLYDRPYMQSEPSPRSRNLVFGIIIFNVIVYAVQLVAGRGFTESLGLTSVAQGGPNLWSFVTYGFLHDTHGMGHIIFNMIGIFFLGRALLPELGEKRFIQAYLGSSIVGGFLWFLVSLYTKSGPLVGASGSLFGLLTCFGLIYGNSDIYFMMVIRMKGKVLLYASLGIALFGLIFLELLNGTGVAHSAHLGGMAGGYLFYKLIYQRDPSYGKGAVFRMPDWLKRKPSKKPSKNYSYKVNIQPKRDLKKEVDRILDKINSQGFGALSPEEKRILDEAGDLLKKR